MAFHFRRLTRADFPQLQRWLAEPLERAGFARVAEGPLEPDNPADGWDHFIYRIERAA